MNMLDNTCCCFATATFSSSPLSTPNLISSSMLVMVCRLIEREVGQESGAPMGVTWCPGASHYIPFFVQKHCVRHRGMPNIGAAKTLRPRIGSAISTFSEPMDSDKTCPIILPIGSLNYFRLGCGAPVAYSSVFWHKRPHISISVHSFQTLQ